LNDYSARARDGARTKCNARPNVRFGGHPSILANDHWPSHESEPRLPMIVSCGTKKGSLTNDRVTAELDPVDAVAVDAGTEAAASFHN
jgi:hypothetical protein